VADEKQRVVLESTAKRGILNCSRQWGKSSVAAVKAVHHAATGAGRLVIVASRAARQSAEFLRKAEGFARAAGFVPRGDGDNAHSILFPNGSRIVGLPGSEETVRGFSAVTLLVIDEASRVTDEMYKALRPMMATSNGNLWVLSTPFGQRGFFHDIWTNGGPEWERVSVPASECPRIGAAFLAEERQAMGEEWFEQEYMCKFVNRGTEWIGRTVVEEALVDCEPLPI
jgi:phage FluMu gp28-like protein